MSKYLLLLLVVHHSTLMNKLMVHDGLPVKKRFQHHLPLR